MVNKRLLVFLSVATVVICLAYSINLFYYTPGLGPTYEVPEKQRISNKNRTIRLLQDLLQSSYLNIRPFEINGNDVMVFLHIQKTGGTSFGKNLVKDLHLERKCEKVVLLKARFRCKRPNSEEFWLYSRFSTGWICGLHADWTTWNTCLPKVLESQLGESYFNKTKFFYTTILRDPINRFLSEFKHVQRGATWSASKFICNNREYNPPHCYKGANWSKVTLTEFLDCPSNLAFNRQTRMLANLTEVGCYNNDTEYFNYSKPYGKLMLESAKRNLRSMAYFGLLEYQRESQYLFEKTFGLKFKRNLSQIPANETMSGEAWSEVTTKLLLQIRKATRLDRQLYNYAKALFFKRLKYFQKVDELEKYHIRIFTDSKRPTTKNEDEIQISEADASNTS